MLRKSLVLFALRRPSFALSLLELRVRVASRDRTNLQACGDTSHPYETISWLLGSADGPRGRADAVHASSLPTPLARDPCVYLSPTRVPPMSVTMAPAFLKVEASGVKTLAKAGCMLARGA